eukprot:2034246-Amphidinium_carterae.1
MPLRRRNPPSTTQVNTGAVILTYSSWSTHQGGSYSAFHSNSVVRLGRPIGISGRENHHPKSRGHNKSKAWRLHSGLKDSCQGGSKSSF